MRASAAATRWLMVALVVLSMAWAAAAAAAAGGTDYYDYSYDSYYEEKQPSVAQDEFGCGALVGHASVQQAAILGT